MSNETYEFSNGQFKLGVDTEDTFSIVWHSIGLETIVLGTIRETDPTKMEPLLEPFYKLAWEEHWKKVVPKGMYHGKRY